MTGGEGRDGRDGSARIAAPLGVGLLLLGAWLGAGCGGGGKSATSTTQTPAHPTVERIEAAATLVQKAITIPMQPVDIRILLVDMCAAASSGNHTTIVDDLHRLPIHSFSDLQSTLTAFGKGAEAYCPDGVALSPNLLNDLYSEVFKNLTSTTAAPTTTAPITTTTHR